MPDLPRRLHPASHASRHALPLLLLLLFALAAPLSAAAAPVFRRSDFRGGAGDQRAVDLFIPAGNQPAARHGWAVGVDNTSSLLLDYDLTSLTASVFPSLGANTSFLSLTLSGGSLFPVGGGLPPTCGVSDGVGDTEGKSIFARYSTGGTFLGCQTVNFFPYRGGESHFRSLAVTEGGTPYVYVVSYAENCGFGHSVFALSKYDTAGAEINKVTEPGVSFGGFNCIGGSYMYGLAALNGSLYLAGQSSLTGAGETGGFRPVLMKYDPGLNRVWKQRPSDVTGRFNAVAAFSGALYAVGTTNGDADYLIEKYDEAGNRSWSKTSGGGATDVLTGVVGVGGRLFAVGYTASSGAGGRDAVILEIDPATGNTLSTTLYGGAQDDMANGAATDGVYLYVVGESRSFTSAAGNAVGQNDAMLLQYCPAGCFVVTNTNDGGAGSLRQAIADANSAGGAQTIIFNIPTTDPSFTGEVFNILPTSAPLPTLLSGKTIDGTTQTTFTGDTNAAGPEVVVNGSQLSSGSGFVVSADNCTIRSLVINGFGGLGIAVGYGIDNSPSNNQILDNYIGTDPTGMSAVPNLGGGVDLHGFASPSSQSSNNVVQNNIISGNGGAGLSLCDAGQNTVSNNLIGVDRTGAGNLGNSGHGITLACAGDPGNTFQNNVIAYNGGEGFHDEPDFRFGVSFTTGGHQGNRLTQNSIYSNGGLGINLLPPPFGTADGVTPNDSCDSDAGGNKLQNFPVITSAVTSGGATTIQGTLNSAAGTTFTLEFFSNAACDSSGNGEGQTYIGSTTVTTAGDCNAAFTFTPSSPVAAGQFITATATDPANNTSEFSTCQQNTAPPPPNSPPVWATTSVNVSEPVGTESDPAQRTAGLTLNDADDGQTLSFAVAGTGDCGAGGTHPFTGLGFDPASVVSGSGDETTSLVLNVGATAAAGTPYCVRVSVSDGASTVEQDLTVNVTAQNSSPILDAGQSPQLSSLYFNNTNSNGNTVAEIVVDGSITDPDGAAAEAIAVTAVDNTNGKWQFSSGGVIWNDFWPTTGSPVDLGAADRLLSDAYYIRFVPDTNFSGTATITFRAWDQTSGTAGGTMETDGGAAFSAASDTASVTVEPALSLTVDSTGDEDDASPGDRVCATAANKCTLRAALQEANAVQSADAVGFDIPTSDPGYDSNTGRYTINLLTTNLAVGGSVTINGPGPNVLTVMRDLAAGNVPVFVVTAGWTASINGMTITNGNNPGGQGGGIYNNGSTLTVSNCVVTGNHAEAGGTGGGIMNHASNSNDATLTVVDSTVSGNSAGNYGGGIGNLADDGRTASLTVVRSTISGNSSSSGGGISSLVNDGVASLTLSNSTVSGNTSNGSGGGVAAVGSSIAFTNVTLTNNRADSDDDDSGAGGALYVQAGSATLGNTIVAGNFNGPSPGTIADDISGAVGASSSFNLIGTGGAGGLADGVNGNHVGIADARLGPLTGNGGVTHTQALLPGSPALDAGDNAIAAAAGLTTDQRGLTYARSVDSDDADSTATVDIGAFEAQVSVENISDKTTDESTQLQFDFNVSDGVSSSNVTATSSDTTLVPNANVQVTGAGSPLTLTIDPAAGKIGTTTITVTVTSGDESMSDTFLLTINLVNDAPSFTRGADQTVSEDAGPHIVSDWATDISAGSPEESGQTLSFLVSNDRNALFSAQPEVSPTGTLTYTPAPNASGSATVTVRLKDDGGGSDTSAPQTFTITVNAVADTPSVTAATTAENTKTTSGLVISRNAADGPEVTHFKITDITNGTLYLTGGSTVIADGQFITFAQGNAGLKFLPSQDLSSPSSSFGFKVQASIGNTDAGLGGSPASATITVNEGGTLRFSASAYKVNEGTASASAVITVLRAGGGAGATSVRYAASGGTAAGYSSCSANKDYVTRTGTLSWMDGDTASKTFAIPICNDTIYEGSETVNLTLSNVTGSGSLGAPSAAVLTIVDNESQPKLSINGVTLAEGNTGARNAAFTVMLSGASSKTVTVNYQTANGSAVAPADYTAVPPTTLTFSPGQTSKTVLVPVSGDLIDELDETFKVVLSSPTNAGLAVSQGTCVITDNDTAVITINNASVTEPDGGTTIMTFTIKLSVPSSRTVSVRYQTANNTATAPADYTARGLTTLFFSPGQTSQSVTVIVKGDLLAEPNETFFVNLSSPMNATIADAQGLGTIINDD